MYLRHFGLREEPFGSTPDPHFLFASRSHREAMASLEYAIESGRGFFALVAPPGMGKTTLLFEALEKYQEKACTAFLFHTQCNSREFLRFLLAEVGLEAEDGDMVRMHHRFNEVLLAQSRKGRRFLLVVDEAQNLSGEVLETIRLLSDFETPRAKLMQIVLAGQPDLHTTLRRPELSQLLQRITMISRIEPFDADETAAYVAHRLAVAGYSGPPIFTSSAMHLLAEAAHGVPRLINGIAFNALSLAFAAGARVVNFETMREAVADLPSTELAAAGVRQAPVAEEVAEYPRVDTNRVPMSAKPASPAASAPVEDAIRGRSVMAPTASPQRPDVAAGTKAAAESAAQAKENAATVPVGVAPQKPREAAPAPVASAPTASRVAERAERLTAGEAETPYLASLGGPAPRVRGLGTGALLLLVAMAVGGAGYVAWERRGGWSESEKADAAQAAEPSGQSAAQPVGQSSAATPATAASGEAEAAPEGGSWSSRSAVAPSRSELPAAMAAPAEAAAPTRVRSSRSSRRGGDDGDTVIVQPQLIKRVHPSYPRAAGNGEGEVVLRARVSVGGTPHDVEVLEGDEVFRASAVEAVRQWKYRPGNYNGSPREMPVTIRLRFSPWE